MNNLDVMQLPKSQVANASEIAATAFSNDPVFCYLTSDNPKRRLRALTWLTSRAVDYMPYRLILGGIVWGGG